MVDFEKIRSQFPALQQSENGHPLVYLDSGATSQKPQVVIDAITKYYQLENANVHRGVYGLSQRATEAYERTREKTRQFIKAYSTKEIIFTSGATEAINLVASSWGKANLSKGDEIIITEMEHHSNIVPWQILRDELGIILSILKINDQGEISIADFTAMLSKKTKLVAITHMSNALGSINPVKEMTKLAHEMGAKVLVDGAQAVPHLTVNVQDINCDFYVFSAHKMYGPTGIGVLYGKQAILESMPPYQAGGDMIYSVTFEKTEYNVLPYKFEAGTPNISATIGLGVAIDFIQSIGLGEISKHEQKLLKYATKELSKITGLTIIGQAQNKGGVISFVIDGVHPHDMATFIDQDGIAIRASHHCAMPVMQKFKISSTMRASFGIYNNFADIDKLVVALNEALPIMRD